MQEALNNVAKHAQRHATSPCASATATGEVDVLVRDDGGGFDPASSSTGFGLLGMRERLALVNGRLEVESAPRSVQRAVTPRAPAHSLARSA